MARQAEIPGTEREVNQRIENVMQILSDKKKAKTRASSAHKDAEAKAIAVMREEKFTSYTSEDLGLTIDLDAAEHAKLSAYAPPKEKGGGKAAEEKAASKSKEDF